MGIVALLNLPCFRLKSVLVMLGLFGLVRGRQFTWYLMLWYIDATKNNLFIISKSIYSCVLEHHLYLTEVILQFADKLRVFNRVLSPPFIVMITPVQFISLYCYVALFGCF